MSDSASGHSVYYDMERNDEASEPYLTKKQRNLLKRVQHEMHLMDGEVIVDVVFPSALWPVLFWWWTGPVLFLLGPFVRWVVHQRIWLITNQRVVAREGLFNKVRIDIPLGKITDVYTKRPLLVQVFQNGVVSVNTAGGPGRELTMTRLPRPEAVADVIRGVARQAGGLY